MTAVEKQGSALASPEEILDAARSLYKAGISAIPIKRDGSKKPRFDWKQYQERRPTPDELRQWFAETEQHGIAVICGAVSGNLEMFEIEGRALDLLDDFRDLARAAGLSELLERISTGYLERTPSGGLHWLYRIEPEDGSIYVMPGNAKLALDAEGEVLFETRGDGGYVIVAPSFGDTSYNGKPWELLHGGVESIATITPEERDALHQCARHFDQRAQAKSKDQGIRSDRPPANIDEESALAKYLELDPYELQKRTLDALTRNGWTELGRTHGGQIALRRPGRDPKKIGHSALLGVKTPDGFRPEYLINYSSSSKDFEAWGHGPKAAYGPLEVRALLDHAGDYAALALELEKELGIEKKKPGKKSAPVAVVDPATPWDDPLPLDGPTPPAFPVQALGGTAEAFARDVARTLQCAEDLPAMCILGAVSAIGLGKVEILLDPSWKQGVNLYLATAIPPAGSKSPAFAATFAPVFAQEQKQREASRILIAEQKAKRRILERELKAADTAGDIKEMTRIQLELDQLEEIHPPRITADDVTVEAFTRLLDQHGRISIVSSEGDFFGNLERYKPEKTESTLGPYLKAFSGDEIKIDRKGEAAPIIIPEAFASLCLTVQPATLQALASNRGYMDRGLPQRFMYSMPPSNVGHRDYLTKREPDQAIRQAWAELIDRQGSRFAQTLHPIGLTLGFEARTAWNEFRQELERRRTPGEDLDYLDGWTTKLEDSTLRAAALLWILDNRPEKEIDLDLMERAIEIGRYWLDTAVSVWAYVGQAPGIEEARTGLEAARRLAEEGAQITRRAIQKKKHGPKGFGSSEQAQAALDVLEEYGYIRCIEARRTDSRVYELHPDYR